VVGADRAELLGVRLGVGSRVRRGVRSLGLFQRRCLVSGCARHGVLPISHHRCSPRGQLLLVLEASRNIQPREEDHVHMHPRMRDPNRAEARCAEQGLQVSFPRGLALAGGAPPTGDGVCQLSWSATKSKLPKQKLWSGWKAGGVHDPARGAMGNSSEPLCSCASYAHAPQNISTPRR